MNLYEYVESSAESHRSINLLDITLWLKLLVHDITHTWLPAKMPVGLWIICCAILCLIRRKNKLGKLSANKCKFYILPLLPHAGGFALVWRWGKESSCFRFCCSNMCTRFGFNVKLGKEWQLTYRFLGLSAFPKNIWMVATVVHFSSILLWLDECLCGLSSGC